MASRFWVGGTGTWDNSDTTHWAATSGGAGGQTVPTASDDVTFDTASSGASYTVTVGAGLNIPANNLTVGQPATGSITMSSTGGTFLISGNMSFASGVLGTLLHTVRFAGAAGVQTVTTNGKILNGIQIQGGATTVVRLLDNLTTSSAFTQNFLSGTGVFDANGKKVSFTAGGPTTITTTSTLTFNDLERVSSGNKTDTLTLVGDIIVNGTFTSTGYATTNPLLVNSATVGTSRNIVVYTTSLANVDFNDVNIRKNYLSLNGTSGNTATTPDTVANSISGANDIDLRVFIDAWDGSATTSKTVLSKSLTNSTNRAWDWRTASGSTTAVEFVWKESGGTTRAVVFSGAVASIQSPGWVRVTLDVDNGSGGHAVALYKSTDNATWTQVGTTQNAGAFTTNIIDSAGLIRVGADDENPGTTAWIGKVYRAQLYNGIAGTLINDFNPGLVAAGATSVTASTGEVWTVNGSATIVNDPITGTSFGDAQNNSGITFPAGVTRFWVGGTGSWSSTTKWSASTGGASGASIPLCQDTVIFDANSVTAGAQTVTLDMPRAGKDIDCTAVLNTPTFAFSASIVDVFGNFLTGTITTSTPNTLRFSSRSATLFKTNNVAFTPAIIINTFGNSTTLIDDLTITNPGVTGGLTIAAGTFNVTTSNVTVAQRFAMATGTLNMGSSTWTMQGPANGTPWNVTGGTVNAGTSILKFTDSSGSNKAFVGNGATYYVVWFSGTGNGAFQISGNNTFTELRADAARLIQFANGSNNTVSNWNMNGGRGFNAQSDYKFVHCNGLTAALTTPDSINNSITGDLDVRCRISLDNYNPGVRVLFVSKRTTTSTAGELDFLLESNGSLVITWWSGGGVSQAGSSTVNPSTLGLTANTPIWFRAVRQNNVAGNFNVLFYYSTDGATPSTWVQIGATVIGAGVANVGDSSNTLNVGGSQSGNTYCYRMLDMQLLAGVNGTLNARMLASDYTTGTTFTSSSTTEVWTLGAGSGVMSATNKVAVSTSTFNGTYTITKGASVGNVKLDAVAVQRCTFSPISTWTANTLSTDSGGNTNLTFAANNKYWIGGSGNWSDTTHWSTTSGGASGAAVPTVSDDVYFDSNSSATAYTITQDTVEAVCNDLYFAAPPSTSGTLTFAGSQNLNPAGNVTLLSGMTYTHGVQLRMQNGATSGMRTLRTNGVSIVSQLTFSNTSTTYQLLDDVSLNSSLFRLINGTLDTNRKAVTIISTTQVIQGAINFYNLLLTPGATPLAACSTSANLTVSNLFTMAGNSQTNRHLLNSSVIGSSRTVSCAATSLTNADFQDITLTKPNILLFSTFAGGIPPTGWLRTSPNGTVTAAPMASGDFAITCAVNASSRDFLSGSLGPLASNTTYTLSVYVEGITGVLNANNFISFLGMPGDATVTYTTAGGTGNAVTLGRWIVTIAMGATAAGSVTIRIGAGTNFTQGTANSVTFSRPQCEAGTTATTYSPTTSSLSWTGTSLGDGLGNSGITFTPAVTRFWVGNGGSWSSTAHWAASTGGGSGATMPLAQDDVVFDANSISSGGQTITIDVPRIGRNITFTGITNSPTLTGGSNFTASFFGNWTMGTGMGTWSTGSNFFLMAAGRSAHTFTCAGKVNAMIFISNTFGGSMTFQDAWSSARIQHFSGTLNTNNQPVTSIYYLTGNTGGAKTLTLGSTVWTLTGDDGAGTPPWSLTDVVTVLNAGTSTIRLTSTSATNKTFTGNGKTYYNLELAGVGTAGATYLIAQANTFNQIISNIEPKTINFQAGTTTTLLTGLDIRGNASTPTVIASNTAGSAATISCASGTVKVVSCTLKDNTATGGATFKAEGAAVGTSPFVSNVTGWTATPADGLTPLLGAASSEAAFTVTVPVKNYLTSLFSGAEPNFSGGLPLVRINPLQTAAGQYYVVLLNIFLTNTWPTGLYAGPVYTSIGSRDQSRRPIQTYAISLDGNDLIRFKSSPNIIRYGQIFGLH
jgi:hypothetical protein